MWRNNLHTIFTAPGRAKGKAKAKAKAADPVVQEEEEEVLLGASGGLQPGPSCVNHG